MRRKLAAGNWKMHGLTDDLTEVEQLSEWHLDARCEVLICPPATLISRMWDVLIGSTILVGAQDCHPEPGGAHTGDVSAAMLADAGASHVILGHSERRTDHGETDALVARKLAAVQGAGMVGILCVGETEAQRDAGHAIEVVRAQLAASLPPGADAARTVIAYEPVWAIGTGRTPSAEDIAQMHAALRAGLHEALGDAGAEVRILYGGSVKPDNAAEIFAIADVDGALVGGASLKARDFSAIIGALDAQG